MRAVVVAMVLALASTAIASPPLQLEQGQPAPFSGALCDQACVAAIQAKIAAAQRSRDLCLSDLESKPSPVSTLVVTGVASFIVGGIVAGLIVAAVK